MSHTTTVNSIPILDPDAIVLAIKELNKMHNLGLKIEYNTDMVYYAGKKETCDIVVKTPEGSYDFGFRKFKNRETNRTEYELRADLFGGSIEKLLGAKGVSASNAPKNCSRQQLAVGSFMQQYSRFATERAARAQGMNVKSYLDSQGNVQIEMMM